MPMEENLAARLRDAAPVGALIGDRVQWFEFGRGDSGGQIKLTIVSAGREWTHGGPDNLDRPRIRFDIRSNDPDEVRTIKRAVIAEMEQPADIGDTRFHPAQLEAERHIDLGEQDGGTSLFQQQIEFLFFHEEL